MLIYVYDPVLYSLEELLFQNIPYYTPDTDQLSWIVFSRKVEDCYEFQIYGRQEIFGRKLLAKLFIYPEHKTVFHHILKYVKASQRELLEDALKEIARRLSQIPILKESK